MRIIIPVKQVPETTSVKMDPVTGTMVREGVESILNPLDLYAVETGVRLKEEYGGEIIVLSMGPPKAVEAIREALAMGCDQGILLSDRSFAGSDTWATAYVLAQAVRKLGPFDLILCGERATDGDTAQVGPGLAAFLDLPVATFTSAIESVTAEWIRVKRLVEGGYERVELELPALLTVVKEISDPRLPTLRGKLKAKNTLVSVWGPADIACDPARVGLTGSPTRVVKVFTPKVARKPEKYVVRDEESLNWAVNRLVGYLKENRII